MVFEQKAFSVNYVTESRESSCCHRWHWWLSLWQWRYNGCDSVSDHQLHDCILNRLFRRKSKKTSKPRVNGLCAGNSLGTAEFPAQMASNAENVSIWWRHHDRFTLLAPAFGKSPERRTSMDAKKVFHWICWLLIISLNMPSVHLIAVLLRDNMGFDFYQFLLLTQTSNSAVCSYATKIATVSIWYFHGINTGGTFEYKIIGQYSYMKVETGGNLKWTVSSWTLLLKFQ